MSVVVEYEETPGGFEGHIVWDQSTPDRAQFGIPLYRVPDGLVGEAESLGLRVIEEDIASFSQWMAFGWRAYPLRWWARARLNVRAARLCWRLGLLEPHQGMLLSWRRDFRPFPWRGLRRYRNHA